MTNNILLRLLSSLSRKEVTRFKEFAHSPYFNKHKDVQNLAAYLSDAYPDFNEKKCNRAVLFQHLYPALPHHQPQLAIVFTYTYRLLEEFLTIEQAVAEGLLEDKALFLRRLRSFGGLTFFEHNWVGKAGGVANDAGIPSPSSSPPGSNRYDHPFRLAAEMDACAVWLSQLDKGQLAEKQRFLDAFYLTEKLRDACELRQRNKSLNSQLEDGLLALVCSEIAANLDKYAAFPEVVVYFHVYNLLKTNNLEEFKKVMQVTASLEARLTKDDLQVVFNYLQNFCISQINKGGQDFLRALFEIYKSQLERELLLVDGQLPEWHYKNIVTTALRLDEQVWVKQFLEQYKTFLFPEVRDNAYSYNLAAWHYHARRFDEVLNLLVKVEYTDLRYNLDAKSLLLRTYYDLEEEEALLSLSEAFKQFLKRNKSLTDFQKRGYFNLLKFTRRAFKLKMEKGFVSPAKWKAGFEELQNEVRGAETIFNQTWLEGKLGEL